MVIDTFTLTPLRINDKSLKFHYKANQDTIFNLNIFKSMSILDHSCKLTNLRTFIDTEQTQTHPNVILMHSLAFLFYTPFKQTENMNYYSSIFFHFKISTFMILLHS